MTIRKVVCKLCRKELGFIRDIIIKSDYDGGLISPIKCGECIGTSR